MKILFLVPHPIEEASVRYRFYQFVPYLEGAGHSCTISSFSTPALFRALRVRGQLGTKLTHTVFCSIRRLLRLASLSRFDLVVIHREAFPFFAPRVENLVLRRHSKVIFSFDDAVYSCHHNNSQLNHPVLYRLKYGPGVNQVLERCQHVIAGNHLLAAHAKQFNRNVTVIPTVVDCARYIPRQATHDPTRPLTVGWIGRNTTSPYLELILPALRRLAENNPGRVRFHFIGDPEYKPDLPALTSVQFRLDRELQDLRRFDIGLMPLPDTPWTQGKCGFKAIQYMATGIATVASPVGISADIIRHMRNGLLANSVEEWVQALQILINDPELRQRLGTEGRRTIEQEYSLHIWGPRLALLFDHLGGAPRETLAKEALQIG